MNKQTEQFFQEEGPIVYSKERLTEEVRTIRSILEVLCNRMTELDGKIMMLQSTTQGNIVTHGPTYDIDYGQTTPSPIVG